MRLSEEEDRTDFSMIVTSVIVACALQRRREAAVRVTEVDLFECDLVFRPPCLSSNKSQIKTTPWGGPVFSKPHSPHYFSKPWLR
jgi:hypothetical protein